MDDSYTYNIRVNDLLKKYGNENSVIDFLVKEVQDGTIGFPFNITFSKDPNVLFDNLMNTWLGISNKKYKMRSYLPNYATYLPPLFRGKPTTIRTDDEIYENVDILSDLFIEDIRLKANRLDEISVAEAWNDEDHLKVIFKKAIELSKDNSKVINNKILREAVYKSFAETKIFSPSWARQLLATVLGSKNLSGKRWLDISAGWGDRLLAAMSLNMDYVGFDPNVNLKKGHNEMITLFGNKKKHKVIYEPFETAEIPGGAYDVVLSSPPFFDIEEYSNNENQSIQKYESFHKWMVYFLFRSLLKAWENLKPSGYLILHIGDSKGLNIKLAEMTNIFIEHFLPNSSWEGSIGLEGSAGFARPVWVWKKEFHSQSAKKWSSRVSSVPNFNMRKYIFYASGLYEQFLTYQMSIKYPFFDQLTNSLFNFETLISEKINNSDDLVQQVENSIFGKQSKIFYSVVSNLDKTFLWVLLSSDIPTSSAIDNVIDVLKQKKFDGSNYAMFISDDLATKYHDYSNNVTTIISHPELSKYNPYLTSNFFKLLILYLYQYQGVNSTIEIIKKIMNTFMENFPTLSEINAFKRESKK